MISIDNETKFLENVSIILFTNLNYKNIEEAEDFMERTSPNEYLGLTHISEIKKFVADDYKEVLKYATKYLGETTEDIEDLAWSSFNEVAPNIFYSVLKKAKIKDFIECYNIRKSNIELIFLEETKEVIFSVNSLKILDNIKLPFNKIKKEYPHIDIN